MLLTNYLDTYVRRYQNLHYEHAAHVHVLGDWLASMPDGSSQPGEL